MSIKLYNSWLQLMPIMPSCLYSKCPIWRTWQMAIQSEQHCRLSIIFNLRAKCHYCRHSAAS